MPDTPEHERIRRRMEKLRHQIDQDMHRVSDNVHQMFDWKQHLRRYPLAIAGAALVAGYLLVPRKSAPVKVELDERTRKELLEQLAQRPAQATPGRKVEPEPSLFRQISTLATNMAVRAAMTYVGQHAGKFVGEQIARHTRESGVVRPPVEDAPETTHSHDPAHNVVAHDHGPTLAVFADEAPREVMS